MLPFDRYPEGGRHPLGRRQGGTSRQGYGLQLRRETDETTCAYCGLDLFSTYDRWLVLQIDHVVPLGVADALGIPLDLYDDMFNLVLACATCNIFDNRFRPDLVRVTGSEWTVEEFVALRDDVFAVRRERIAARHVVERAFFEKLPALLAGIDAKAGRR